MKSKAWVILKKEIKELFRDKKSLAMMLAVPLMIPLLIIGFSYLFDSEVETPVEEYNHIGFAYPLTDVEKSIVEKLEIDPVYGTEEEIKQKYEDGELSIYMSKDGTSYTIKSDDSDTSARATSLLESYFESYKNVLTSDYLSKAGVNPEEALNLVTLDYEVDEDSNFISNYLSVYAFMFIIMAITISATYPATDATAGEKERGTLETLLTFPIKSKDIIIGKYLSVALSSVITGLLGLILMQVSLKYVSGAFSIYEGMNILLPLKNILILVVVIIAYSLLISGLCIAIASKSKTFKEAQSALTPLNFISFFPGMIAYMMNVETTFALSWVPFLNFTLIFNDMSNGIIEIPNIIAMFISTIVFIIVILLVIIKQYRSEKILFTN